MKKITLKSKDEIALMRQAGRIAALCIEKLISLAVPGNTPLELDRAAEDFMAQQGGVPSFKGYLGYPASTCISVNEEVVHGIPNCRPFQEGDLVSIDIGVNYQGYHGDMAVTVAVGKVSKKKEKLIQVTREALFEGIGQARAGNHLSDISHAIETRVKRNGFSVVRELIGHGVGRELHEEPQIPNYGKAGEGVVLESGMIFALEPMVNMGTERVKVGPDGWTFSSEDSNLSAHWEHTIAITESDAEILTVP